MGEPKAKLTYSERWDLSTIPPEKIISEYKRLISLRRKTYGAGTGRKPKLAECPRCGQMAGARDRKYGICCKASKQKGTLHGEP